MRESLISSIFMAMNTFTSHGIARMQVILIIKTMKLSIRVTPEWDAHNLF